MAMLVKPKKFDPPHGPFDLDSKKKNPLSKCVEEASLQYMLDRTVSMNDEAIPDKPLIYPTRTMFNKKDDFRQLDAWMSLAKDLSNLYVSLDNQLEIARHKERGRRSRKERILNNVYQINAVTQPPEIYRPKDPVEGWYGLRCPTPLQLLQNSRVIERKLQEQIRQDESQRLSLWFAARNQAEYGCTDLCGESGVNDYRLTVKLANMNTANRLYQHKLIPGPLKLASVGKVARVCDLPHLQKLHLFSTAIKRHLDGKLSREKLMSLKVYLFDQDEAANDSPDTRTAVIPVGDPVVHYTATFDSVRRAAARAYKRRSSEILREWTKHIILENARARAFDEAVSNQVQTRDEVSLTELITRQRMWEVRTEAAIKQQMWSTSDSIMQAVDRKLYGWNPSKPYDDFKMSAAGVLVPGYVAKEQRLNF